MACVKREFLSKGAVELVDLTLKVLQGAKLIPLAASVAIGLAIRFLIPIPEGITANAWSLLSIFVSTIAGRQQYDGLCLS